jgi:hypothetical protein
VLGPDVNESRANFTPVGDKIRFGLAGIKGVGEGAALKIIEEREANGPYRDFDETSVPGGLEVRQQAGARAPGEDRRLRLRRRTPQTHLRPDRRGHGGGGRARARPGGRPATSPGIR